MSSEWVPLQSLGRSEPLTRMAKPLSSGKTTWATRCKSPSPVIGQIRITDDNDWTPIQDNIREIFRFDNAPALAIFLHAPNASTTSSPSSITSYFNNFILKKKSSLIFFAALLICMENTFWNIHKDVNFVDLFKASFSLYVGSGMRKKAEAVIDILRKEQGRHPVTKDFLEKFHKIIVEHCLPHPGDKASEMPGDERKISWLKRLMRKKL